MYLFSLNKNNDVCHDSLIFLNIFSHKKGRNINIPTSLTIKQFIIKLKISISNGCF